MAKNVTFIIEISHLSRNEKKSGWVGKLEDNHGNNFLEDWKAGAYFYICLLKLYRGWGQGWK